jgi:protein TonB
VRAGCDAQGAVTDARVVIGPEQLRKTVLANVLEWHFAAGSSSARVNVTFGDPKADGSMQARPGAPILDPLPVPPPVRAPYVFSRILFGGLSSELEQRVRAKLGFKEDQSVNKTLAEITATVQKVDPHLTVGIAATPTELSTNPRVSLTLRINLPVTAAIVVGPGYAGGGSSRPSMTVPSGTLQVGIDQLRIQNKVPPAYTKQVKEAGVQGSVKLDLLIGADGRVGGASLQGPPLLQQAVMDAVRQWVFEPYQVNGQAVPVVTSLEFDFKQVR